MSEGWRKCPRNGCPVAVWGRVDADNYCGAHGGPGLPETDDTEWGTPRIHGAARARASSPSELRPPQESDYEC